MEVVTLKNISPATLGFGKRDLQKMVDDKPGVRIHLARIGGTVLQIAEYKDKYTGEMREGFKGIFMAMTTNGKKFSATSLYLPTYATDDLAKAVRESANEVNVALDLYVEASEKSGTGYRFACDPAPTKDQTERARQLSAAIFEGFGGLQLTDQTETKKKGK